MKKHIAGVIGDVLLILGVGGAVLLTTVFPELGIALLCAFLALAVFARTGARHS